MGSIDVKLLEEAYNAGIDSLQSDPVQISKIVKGGALCVLDYFELLDQAFAHMKKHSFEYLHESVADDAGFEEYCGALEQIYADELRYQRRESAMCYLNSAPVRNAFRPDKERR